jgi:hypothetical protein
MMKKLFSTTCIPTCAGYKKSPFLRQFAQGEDGNVTVLSLFFIAILLLLAGVSWDVNSHEYHRVKIQNTADRAVLAAADLDQTLDPQEVVNDYFEKVGYPDLVASVNVDEGLNYRTVSVNVEALVQANTISGTYDGSAYEGGRSEYDALENARDRFDAQADADVGLTLDQLEQQELASALKSGNEYVELNAIAEAEERVNNVEISMVLDISGSMGSNDKMDNLRNAARTFVDTVVTDATKDLVSLSIVPYSEHVSAGPDIMGQFNVDINNPYSHCIEFDESDFDTVAMTASHEFDQVQHFTWGSSSYNSLSNPVCPTGQYEDIEAFSQDVSALKAKISELEPRGSTSIFAGMKWAAGLLDPAFQPMNAALADDGVTDQAFSDRPAAYDDNETLKTVILMTDGQNHYSYRINDNYYANASHAAHWNKYNLDWYLNRYVRSSSHSSFKYLKYWPDYGDTLLNNICTAAKEEKIVIWSIGFEVTDSSAQVMENCASSPSHFFRVEGVEIKDAFKAIARQINQLRLTQ